MAKSLFLFLILSLLQACTPVKMSTIQHYKLDSFSDKKFWTHRADYSILVTPPEALAGYQTEDMVYMEKRFELGHFRDNAWVSPPADMLYPLIIQSLERSGYFYSVSSGSNSLITDYKLDTQLIELKQNFIEKPSKIHLTVKVTFSDARSAQVIASRLFTQRVSCPAANPYGGVVAANHAAKQFTTELIRFIAGHLGKNKNS